MPVKLPPTPPTPPTGNEPPCNLCKGTGKVSKEQSHLDVDGVTQLTSTVTVECTCVRVKWIKDKLKRTVLAKPLLPMIEGKRSMLTPLVIPNDYSKEKVFITGPWAVVAPHIKATIVAHWMTNQDWTYAIVSDLILKNSYLGNDKYETKTGDMDTKTTHLTLMDPSIDLVVVRLGYVAAKNALLPGILHECLNLRENSPTWIVEGSRPWREGHYCWSDEVAQHITDNYEPIDITGDA